MLSMAYGKVICEIFRFSYDNMILEKFEEFEKNNYIHSKLAQPFSIPNILAKFA